MKQKIVEIMSRIFADIKKYGIGMLLVVIYLLAFSLLFHEVCPARLFFGLPCPGCGMTRAIFLLMTLHPYQAIKMNPSIIPAVIFFIYMIWNRYIIGRKTKLEQILLIGFLGFMIVSYGFRMYYLFPNTEPLTVNVNAFIFKLIGIIEEFK